jgi:hypothetical protein
MHILSFLSVFEIFQQVEAVEFALSTIVGDDNDEENREFVS